MLNAAKNKSRSPAGPLVPLALRVLLLLVVALCLGQTRVWGFGVTPQPASGVFESVTPSSIWENYDGCPYDASDSLLAAKTTGEIVKDVGLAGRIGQSGMTTRQAGEFFGWGSKEITKPLSSFSRESLGTAGWTREKLLDVAQGYRKLAEVTPNKSAPLRAEQLENLANLFGK